MFFNLEVHVVISAHSSAHCPQFKYYSYSCVANDEVCELVALHIIPPRIKDTNMALLSWPKDNRTRGNWNSVTIRYQIGVQLYWFIVLG
jgi:hypothetical protein